MKVTVKKKDDGKLLPIETEYIKLEAALKFAALVATGGEAKAVIADGLVTVLPPGEADYPLILTGSTM